MSDPLDQPDPVPTPPEPETGPLPWEGDPPPPDPEAPPQRHDAFTIARRHAFLKALAKTGCFADACRLTGVAPRTAYRHRDGDDDFGRYCDLALRMRELPIELTAWDRAVNGVQEEYVAGGEVRTRTRYSDGLLRLLLVGANPKKYGPRPGFTRKRLLKHERDELERQVRAEWKAKNTMSFDDAITALHKRLQHLNIPIQSLPPSADEAERISAGWTRTPEGHMVPPGYGPLAPPPPSVGDGDPL